MRLRSQAPVSSLVAWTQTARKSTCEWLRRAGNLTSPGPQYRAAPARAIVAWKVAGMMGRISQEVVVALRGALHRKLMRLPMAYFDAQQTGRLMARVTSDVGSILMFIRSGILQLLNDLTLSVAIAVLLGWLEWRLAVVALVTVPLYALNQRYFFGILRGCRMKFAKSCRCMRCLANEFRRCGWYAVSPRRTMSWTNSTSVSIIIVSCHGLIPVLPRRSVPWQL